VDRLCALLDHPIELTSIPGRGSCFAVDVPLGVPRHESDAPAVRAPRESSILAGKLVVVIDDDPLARESMAGLLRIWGCDVVTATRLAATHAALASRRRPPDCIVSDYRLPDGVSGIAAIERLRKAIGTTIPAMLVTGDVSAERVSEARDAGYPLLHKPLNVIALRSLLHQLLISKSTGPGANEVRRFTSPS
jgi:CheY-like chemotaxis protein